MLKFQILFIAVLIACFAFISCDRAQQIMDPAMDDMMDSDSEMMDDGMMTDGMMDDGMMDDGMMTDGMMDGDMMDGDMTHEDMDGDMDGDAQ